MHAHVLMSNHYHLLLETPKANLSREMRKKAERLSLRSGMNALVDPALRASYRDGQI